MTPNLELLSTHHRGIAAASSLLLLTALAAQTAPAPRSRIQAAISNAQRIVLRGSRPVRARARFDVGPMPASTRLRGITLVFNRSAAQQADLTALLAAQQNPASPLYHQWLTPAQFGARFGMSTADLAKVEAWLRQQGFAIERIAPSRDRIRFSGTVAQVEAAFAAPMHYFQSGRVRHFAPAADLSLPAAIAPTVLAIRNLDDFRPRPHLSRPRPFRANPHFTSSISGSVFFAPGDIATAYDVASLYSKSFNGAGQAIAVVGQSAVNLADIEAFQNAAGLPVKDPSLILVPNSGVSTVFSTDEAESDVDLEWAGAVARDANIDFVYVGGNTNLSVFDALTYAVSQDIAPIISMSYGNCEAAEASGIPALESTLQQAAAQGQSVVVAAGDFGSTDCSGDTNLTTAQQQSLAVDYPSSSEYATGVGGTEISSADMATGTGYWQPATSGSDVLTSALKYIPEIAWNDDTPPSGSNPGVLSAGGGGASTLYSSKPAWQTGVPGIPADNERDVPDLALYASPSFPGYLYCSSDTSVWQSNQQASCNNGFRDAATNDLTVAGGASFAAPIFAGMVAILNQEAGYTAGQGLVNPTLYSLAAKASTYAAAFHDVTTGNNDCNAGSALCGSTTGFAAGVGYDQATGLGSVDLGQLALAWPVNPGPALVATTTTVTASNASPAMNANVTFTITVAPVSGASVPTGAVSLTLDGNALPAMTLAANGTAVYTTSFATAGAHQLLVAYSGDTAFARSTGVATVNAALVSSGKGSFTMSATNLTIASGGSGNSTITITPSGGYSGTVLLGFTTSNPTALAHLCSSFAAVNASGQGAVAVSGTAPITTTLTLDGNANDCNTAALSPGAAPRSTPAPGGGPLPLYALAALATLLLLGFFAARRSAGLGPAPVNAGSRRYRRWFALAALAAAALAAAGCGGGTTPLIVANPPAGVYTITVTGADSTTSTITASTSFTFTIQ